MADPNVLSGDNPLSYDNVLIEQFLVSMQRIIECRDHETASHSQRVAQMAVALGQRMHLEEAELQTLHAGAHLHDIGKLGIPDAILFKPAALSSGEWAIVRRHPVLGAELILPVPALQEISLVILHHHERWDGDGYPNQLQGQQIPLLARVCAVVNVLDSLLNDQPYRPAWPLEMAVDYIERQANKEFDPLITALVRPTFLNHPH